jgi:hypothetical protein
MRGGSLHQRLGKQTAEQRTIHLDHVRHVHGQKIGHGLFDDGMVSSNIHSPISAQTIEISLPLTVIKKRTFSTCINFVEPNGSQHLDQGAVHIPIMEVVVLPQSAFDKRFDVEGHGACGKTGQTARIIGLAGFCNDRQTRFRRGSNLPAVSRP